MSTPQLHIPLDWVSQPVSGSAGRRALVAALAAGVTLDLAVRSGVAGLAGALAVVVGAVGLLAAGPVESRQARVLVLGAPVFGCWLLVRSSPWLVLPDLAAAAGLLALGASLARGGSVFDLSFPGVAARAMQLAAHALGVPRFTAGALAGRDTRRARPLLAGLGLAAPLLVVLGALLASADAVFAGFFRLPAHPGDLGLHAVLFGGGAAGLLALVRASRAEPAEPPRRALALVGPTEATVVLAALVALFAAFAAAQAVAATEGGRRVIETAGLTYAEYARSGFFQLLAVAGITLAVLLVLRAVTDLSVAAARRRFVVLAEVAVALTLVVVAVAVRRLHLYEQAYGLTMLRLYSTVFALWIGAVFVAVGVSIAGVAARRHWLPAAAAGLALAALLTLNVVDAEAYVVRRDAARAVDGVPFDTFYLAGLSADAVPALVDALPTLPDADRAILTELLCQRPPDAPAGWGRLERVALVRRPGHRVALRLTCRRRTCQTRAQALNASEVSRSSDGPMPQRPLFRYRRPFLSRPHQARTWPTLPGIPEDDQVNANVETIRALFEQSS